MMYSCASIFLKSRGVTHFTMGEENIKNLIAKLKAEAKDQFDMVVSQRDSESAMTIASLTGISSILYKPFNMKVVGDSYRSDGSYDGTYFTCDEYLEDAKAEYLRISKKQKEGEDYYHNNYRGS